MGNLGYKVECNICYLKLVNHYVWGPHSQPRTYRHKLNGKGTVVFNGQNIRFVVIDVAGSIPRYFSLGRHLPFVRFSFLFCKMAIILFLRKSVRLKRDNVHNILNSVPNRQYVPFLQMSPVFLLFFLVHIYLVTNINIPAYLVKCMKLIIDIFFVTQKLVWLFSTFLQFYFLILIPV